MFDCIIANPPYAKIGVDITKTLINEIPHKDISILGTAAMLGKHNHHLAIEYVYICNYTLHPETKCKWVGQIILLGHKGQCETVPSIRDAHNGELMPNELRVPFPMARSGDFHISFDCLTTRNRVTSWIISVSDEDFEFIKEHWGDMGRVERFYWLMDKGLYKRFYNIEK